MGNMGVCFRIFVLAGLIGIPFAVSPSRDACAGIATQSCDPQVWRALEDRAELETEREIMQNQNLIFKPDSVLNYTCFDSFAAHAAMTIGPLFTHSTYFGGIIIQWEGGPGYIGMGDALHNVVGLSMQQFTTEGSFGFYYLGGRAEFLPPLNTIAPPDPANLIIPQRGAAYACNVMQQVWATAKCLNFVHNAQFATTDGYYPFKNILPFGAGEAVSGYQTILETRRYPTSLSCAVREPFYDSTWDLKTQHSLNVGDVYYNIHDYNLQTFNQVRERVEPGIACAPAIHTGVTILLTTGTGGPDGVCSNPGCSYVNRGCIRGPTGTGAATPGVTGPQ